MQEEIWKPVVGYEGLYSVSSLGRVRRETGIDSNGHLRKERILKTDISKKQYHRVNLWKNGKGKHFFVHRLVAEAFIPNPDNLPFINHRDENTQNNMVDNLEWCTIKYNNSYGTRLERISQSHINGKDSKRVFQYTLDDEFIREWPSTMEIQRQLGFFNQAIGQCCLGNIKTAYGYIWKYVA